MNMKTKLLIGGAVLAAGATTYIVVKNAKKKKAENEGKTSNVAVEDKKEVLLEENKESSKQEEKVGKDTIIDTTGVVVEDISTDAKNEGKEETKSDDCDVSEKSDDQQQMEEAKKIADEIIHDACREAGVENIEELIKKSVAEAGEIKTKSDGGETLENNKVNTETTVSEELDALSVNDEDVNNPEVIEAEKELAEVSKNYRNINSQKKKNKRR